MFLGNLDAKRDWGHAKDYVYGMWQMMQQDKADDFVLATGETHSVREFVEKAFSHVDIKIKWEGEGAGEKGRNAETNDIIIEVDKKYFRPTEVEVLLGDPGKAKKELGWEHKYTFDELVKEMVEADVKLFERDKYLLDGGHKVYNYHE